MPRMSRGIALVMLLTSSVALAIPVDEVSRPRSGWVQDLTGTLRPEVVRELTQLGDAVDGENAGQLGVAIVDSTDGESPRTYATRLFNNWGVGHADRKVLGKHKDQFVVRCERAMHGRPIP